MATASVESPKGTEELARGDELMSVRFRIGPQNTDESVARKFVVSLSWNEICAIILPHLISPAFEGELQAALAERLSGNAGEDIAPHQVTIFDEDFRTILLQLKALGIILVDRERQKIDTGRFWMITPYGENLMTQLKAIKSAKPAAQAVGGLS